MNLRQRVIAAIHALEAQHADPTVEQYADAALSGILPVDTCTCSVDPLDRMPLIDGRCPTHSPAAIAATRGDTCDGCDGSGCAYCEGGAA